MYTNQSTTRSFIPRLPSVPWSNQVVPLNDQQHYRNNTNEWIANAHEQTSPNEQFTNQTNSSVTLKRPYICSDVSSYTLWTIYLTAAITMDINTSNCTFNSTPMYFTSLGGTGLQYFVGGYTAIYTPNKESFKIYTMPDNAYNNTVLLNYSQTYQWDVNWFGISE